MVHPPMMSPRPRTAAAFAVVLFVAGHVAAFAHEATTRHVVCSEHGELLESATTSGASAVAQDREHAVWTASGQGGSAHEDCVIARALHQSGDTPRASGAPSCTTIVSSTAPPIEIARLPSADELLLIAPKTSPPA